ncbi:unnamed protein product, partial [Oppiella nova]
MSSKIKMLVLTFAEKIETPGLRLERSIDDILPFSTASGVAQRGPSKNLWFSLLSLLSLIIQTSLQRQSHGLAAK